MAEDVEVNLVQPRSAPRPNLPRATCPTTVLSASMVVLSHGSRNSLHTAMPFSLRTQCRQILYDTAKCMLLLHCSYVCSPAAHTAHPALVRAQGLLHQVCRIGGHRQDAQRVRVAKAALPALHRDDGRASLDDVERESVSEAEADTVVDL